MCTFYTLNTIFVSNYLKMKKAFLMIGIVVTLFSCKKDIVLNEEALSSSPSMQTGERLASQEKIKLLKSWSVYAWVYHGAYNKEKAFYAEVANLAYTKKVYVHHKMNDGTWADFPLSYMKAGDNGSEIWGMELSYGGYGSVIVPGTNIDLSANGFGTEYTLKYVVNGQIFWDNNGGRNYTVANPYASDGMYLQNGLNISADTYHSTYNKYNTGRELQVYADVRNISYQKDIKLVYSTDDWKTVKYATVNFLQYYSVGNGSVLPNPNVYGIEKWSVIVSLGNADTKVSYALSYKVNGVEYWDNNFGKNYTLYRN